ncbi:hypothetical protein ACTFIW_008363 [Dictyostelium discoideum]
MEHCTHYYLYSKLLQYGNLVYIDEILRQHNLPLFQAGICTNQCKERMKKIIKVSMDTYLKAYLDYWDDAKVIEGKEKVYPRNVLNYYFYLSKNATFDLNTPKALDVGVVDGKTVRLCNNTNEYIQPKLPQKYIYQDMLTLGENFEEFREDSSE